MITTMKLLLTQSNLINTSITSNSYLCVVSVRTLNVYRVDALKIFVKYYSELFDFSLTFCLESYFFILIACLFKIWLYSLKSFCPTILISSFKQLLGMYQNDDDDNSDGERGRRGERQFAS